MSGAYLTIDTDIYTVRFTFAIRIGWKICPSFQIINFQLFHY